MLGQHIQRADPLGRGVLRAFVCSVNSGAALQHFKAVGRHQQRARGLVEPVVGAPDPLRQAACALGRADIDDEIDIAPVNAKVQRRGADDGLDPACHHRRLHPAALAGIERAVMQRDGQRVVIDAPQLGEHQLSLRPRVDENQRHFCSLDGSINLGHRVARHVAGPGQALLRVENVEHRFGAALRHDQRGHRRIERLRDKIAAQLVRRLDRCGQARGAHLRRKRAQPGEVKRQQVAALGGDQRMQLVQHNALQRREKMRRVSAGQQQRHLLGRRHQYVRRIAALALAARGGCIAGARLDADGQRHLGHWLLQVARHIDCQRLQRRDVQRVQMPARAGGALVFGKCYQ